MMYKVGIGGALMCCSRELVRMLSVVILEASQIFHFKLSASLRLLRSSFHTSSWQTHSTRRKVKKLRSRTKQTLHRYSPLQGSNE